MRRLKRILSWAALAVLVFCLFFAYDSAGVFFNEISEGIADYNIITESELKKNLPVQGTVYTVYDCIAVSYNSDSGDDEEFYYLIEFDENNNLYMLLETKADSQLNEDIDELCDAYVFGGNDALLQEGVMVDGILVENDSGVVQKFNEWKDDMKEYGEDSSAYSLVPYTYDCSYTVDSFHSEFIKSAVGIVVSLAVLILMIVLLVKSGKNNRISAPVGGNYIPQPNFGVPNQYNPQPNMYNQNNQFGQNNYYSQNIPQAANINMKPQDPNYSTFIPNNSFGNSGVQNNNIPTATVYAEEQKVSLDKKNY